jgi:hypothetical protein
MKITIEVNVPEDMDLDHAYQSVTDALANGDLFSGKYVPHNVTKDEQVLVASILNQLASNKNKKLLPNGFRDWVETHHEMVCTIHAFIDNDTIPKRIQNILDTEGFAGLYDLGIELTTDFCNTYKDREWNGDWIDTIIDFVNEKLQ